MYIEDSRTNRYTPTAAWRLTAHSIAGRPRMRVAEIRSRRAAVYSARGERDLTDELPLRPAAVMISDDHGCARTLCLDLDAHDGSHTPRAVGADFVAIRDLLSGCGLPSIADAAHGGIHLYGLIEPVPMADARELVGALGHRFVTLDTAPHDRGDQHRCITTPGTVHKNGGHRVLLDPLDEVQEIVMGPRGTTRALDLLRAALSDEVAAYRATAMKSGRAAIDDDPTLSVSGILPGVRHMAPWIDALARSGDFRAAGKPSASEARFTVLCSAAAVGMEQSDVQTLIAEGTWAGLGQLLAHKDADRLAKEWASALAYLAAQEGRGAVRDGAQERRSVSTDLTRVPTGGWQGLGLASPTLFPGEQQKGPVSAWLRVLHAVETVEFPGCSGWKTRMALRVLAGFAREDGTRMVAAVGVRALALGADLSHETVSQVLRELREASDPWIVLLERGVGADADLYELRIPDRYSDIAGPRACGGGPHGVRPVFSELGIPAALVFEAAEEGRAGSVQQIRRSTGLSKAATYAALQTLVGWHLLEQDRHGYKAIASEADLDRLARRLGVDARRTERIQEYRRQRADWHAYLARVDDRRADLDRHQSTEWDVVTSDERAEMAQAWASAAPQQSVA